MAWETGKSMPAHTKEKLHPAEIQYFRKYGESLDKLSQDLFETNNMDLTVDMAPPKDLYIEVRILQACGKITLPESGEVDLVKNSTYNLRRSDVDHLVKQGIMAEVV